MTQAALIGLDGRWAPLTTELRDLDLSWAGIRSIPDLFQTVGPLLRVWAVWVMVFARTSHSHESRVMKRDCETVDRSLTLRDMSCTNVTA